MPLTEQRPPHKFDVGEEVVVRLEAGNVFEVTSSDLVCAALPDWTIAEIVSREMTHPEPRYRVTFSWVGGTYGCTVDESAIDGTA
jgi:hypothetical protein